MNFARFDAAINFALGQMRQNCRDLRRCHLNRRFALRAKGFKPFAGAAIGDGFAEFDFDFRLLFHLFVLFSSSFGVTICLTISTNFVAGISSPRLAEKVLDFFGQSFDIFRTMNEATENKAVIYEFGKFVLDPQERVLLADGKSVHLTDKVFDTLLLLIQHNGRLLTKDEMMSSLWEESFVEESNLAKNISRLRKILNTDGVELIETLPKRGYRFRADVRAIDGETNLLVHRNLRVRVSQTIEKPSDEQKTLIGQNSLNEIHSIAVLPFQPLGAKADDDYFGLGITDALITQLNRAGQVQVRPTSSILKYNVLEQNALSAGQELQVDAILEGRFQRFENKLRLTVQMLHTANGDSLWADGFNTEVEDIFDVQDQIAERVVGSLSKKLSEETQAKLKKRDTENVEAYQEYLKGRYFWNKCTMEGYAKAIECFQKAIDIDPLYALAYAGLAGIYNVLPVNDGFAPHDYFPKAKAAALKALEIDPNLAEAHTAFGLAILHYDWNWSGAEVSFQHAIKLNPNYSNAYELLGVYLCRVERVGEAIAALKKAEEIDPLSPINAVWLAEVFRYCGETEASIRLHTETLKSFPDFYPAHYHLAFSYLDCGRLTEAETHCEKAVSLAHENSLTLSLQGIMQVKLGNNSAVQETLDKLLQMKAEKYISSCNIASVYASLGDEAKAMEWLETALQERDPNLTWIKFDKEFEFLGQNPRFQTILQEVGLAEKRVKLLEKPQIKKSVWKPLLALGILAVLIISALGFYFWKREKSIVQNEGGAIRLTDNPKDENYPSWTKDGRIRFLRTGSDKQTESVVMNADGTNQIAVKDFNNFDYGFWSPDETKIIFFKRGDKTSLFLAGADGSSEIKLPFSAGNFDWSPDSQKIVYQKKMSAEDADIFVYSLETGESKNVTNNPAFDADPNFSPDNTKIVFASLRDGNAEIYLINSDGSDVRRLTNHPAWDSHPVFSPDGTTIAFPSNRDNESSDVYLMNADGSNIRALTDWQTDEYVGPGCWSPDGTRLAFISNRDGSDDIFLISAEIYRPRLVLADEKSNLQFPFASPDGKQIVFQAENKSGELRIFDVETRANRVLLKTENADIAPVFSPDGNWIAFQNRVESNTEICLIKSDGSDFQNLTNNAARDVNPAFSPDGTKIVFASNRDGNYGIYNLYLMNADGSNQRQIYASKGMSLDPEWLPDGKQIIFTNDKEDGATGNFEIFKIEPDTSQPEKRLTFRRRSDTQPAVSPDGKLIAFVSNTDGNAEIYVQNSDGTRLLRLTRNQAEDTTPQFSRDGKRIIFSSNRDGKFALYEIKIAE